MVNHHDNDSPKLSWTPELAVKTAEAMKKKYENYGWFSSHPNYLEQWESSSVNELTTKCKDLLNKYRSEGARLPGVVEPATYTKFPRALKGNMEELSEFEECLRKTEEWLC